ncbi:ABC transporter substrate-binding protein [Acidihalobacter ferrooxydans]|uniref:ABC transporter substrate-binding protein n=1 Tax=Acidihalobacter ferrooxydans TaxID=1765967 RepID=A0A1P8UDI3_9GAMM|nr:ABC transporter substrate-binding protein [Acidihalobacter ferrooxydans]APZ41863.1 ABC transporter substrate-binding protein [Acidihalobacter ferrooxydans]
MISIRSHAKPLLLALAAGGYGLCGIAHAAPSNTLIVGQSAAVKSLDPATVTSASDYRIDENIYQGLVGFKSGTLTPAPSLATRWTIGDKGLTYTFHLRRGVRFQDGTPFNAQAVKFNFDRMLDKSDPYHDTGPFPLATLFYGDIARIDTPNADTVVFHLKHAYAPFLTNLAYPAGLIVSPAAVKRYGKDYGSHPVGTGPFEFASWQRGREITLTRNPHYWGTPANLDKVIFKPVPNTQTRMAELLSGSIDLMYGVPAESLKLFRGNPRFTIHAQVAPSAWYVMLNQKQKPLHNRLVRQALNYAVNKRAIAEDILKGTAVPANGLMSPAFKATWDSHLAPYAYNPAKARKLLREAGYPHGFSTTFYVPTNGSGMLAPVAMASVIQNDLAQVGVKVKLRTFTWTTYLDKVNPGLKPDVGMAEMAWITNNPFTLPNLTLRTGAWPDKGGFNSGYYSNPEVDTLMAQARRATNPARQAAIYTRLQKIVHNDPPWIFVVNAKQVAVTSSRVQGFKLQPSYFLLLDGVHLK